METVKASGRHVMVVDDDQVMRDVLALVLESSGFTVWTAESGPAALEALGGLSAVDAPQCLLVDLQMPGLCGSALGTRLRATCPPETVLVAMSGSRPRAGEADTYDGFLLKPFSAEEFLGVVRAAATGKPSAPASPPPASPLDRTIYLRLREAIPPEQLAQMYALCLTDAEGRLGRMRAAAEQGDAALYVREAHAIKGGCGMLGAAELAELAGRMETGALASTPLLDEFSLAAERLRRMLEAQS